jgi:hypothetical protein
MPLTSGRGEEERRVHDFEGYMLFQECRREILVKYQPLEKPLLKTDGENSSINSVAFR